MSVSGAPFSQAAVPHSTLTLSASLDRTTQFVVGRLLRFWDSRNIKKNCEFMGIMLLFLDEKLTSYFFYHH